MYLLVKENQVCIVMGGGADPTGKAAEEHEVERVVLSLSASAKVVTEQERRLTQADSDAELHHCPFIPSRPRINIAVSPSLCACLRTAQLFY